MSLATRASSSGFGLILIGTVGFLVGCFLPYSSAFLPGERSYSFFRMMVTRRSALADLAGYVDLFVPLAVVAVIAAIGLVRPRWWTVPALLGGASVWAISWLASLLSVIGSIDPLRYGSWFMIGSVVVVTVGAILVAISGRRGATLENDPERQPVPGIRA